MATGCSAHISGNAASMDYRFVTGYGIANIDGTAYLHWGASGCTFTGTVGITDLDITGSLDLSLTSTAAAQLLNSDLTVNHATGVGVAVDATAVQATTARTGGYMAGFRAKTTSLAGDLNGVIYAGLYCLAPTDGGGAAVHVGVYDAGNDYAVIGADNVKVGFGTGSAGIPDISVVWDATKLVVSQLTANSAVEWGVDGAGLDQVWYGDTAGAKMTWDQSADILLFAGMASVRGLRHSTTTAPAISGATALVLADAGGTFVVAQTSAYDIDLPSPTTGGGCSYTFVVGTAGAFNVTITVASGAATFIGTITTNTPSVVAATGSTLTFATGAAAVGDTIVVRSIATDKYLVQAITSAAAGITIT